MDFLPGIAVGPGEVGVGLARGIGLFPLEFLETLPAVLAERALGKRREHRATGFGGMAAIVEAALRGQGGDVGKRVADGLRRRIPELQLAHPWRVDDEGAARGHKEFPAGRGVPALVHGITEGGGGLLGGPEQPVDEGGFADARRTEQGKGGPRREPWGQPVEAIAVRSAERDDRSAGGDRDGLGFGGGGVGMQIGLVEHDNRLGSAIPGQGQVAFDAAQVVIAIQGSEQEHGVEVGGDDLLFGQRSGGTPGKLRAPGQHGMDVRAAFAGPEADDDPITDRRQGGAGGGVVEHPAGAGRGHEFGSEQDLAGVLVRAGNPRGQKITVGIRLEVLREAVVPTEGGQSHGRKTLSQNERDLTGKAPAR